MSKQPRNEDYYKSMVEIRRSNRAQPHKNLAREAKKGSGKGGRNSWRKCLD